jgi:hypothetical protein
VRQMPVRRVSGIVVVAWRSSARDGRAFGGRWRRGDDEPMAADAPAARARVTDQRAAPLACAAAPALGGWAVEAWAGRDFCSDHSPNSTS